MGELLELHRLEVRRGPRELETHVLEFVIASVTAGGDHQRRSGVAEVVEGELGHPRVAGGWLEDPREEGVAVERCA